MMSKTSQQIVIAIVAGVWLVLALLSGQHLSPTPLKLYSTAGTVVTLLVIAWNRYIWKLKLARKVTGTPFIAGTWRGDLKSSYSSSGTAFAAIPATIVIRQTASSVKVTMHTKESSSMSVWAKLERADDDRWMLSWMYDNEPRPSVRSRSAPHTGAAKLYLGGAKGERLSGSYFTDRETTGELSFAEWSKSFYGDAGSALDASDFQSAHPFA